MRQIVSISKANELHGLVKFRRLMRVTHDLMQPRFDFFANQPYSQPFGSFFRSPSASLLTGKGACEDFSSVFTRLLQVSGESARTMQLRCNPYDSTCHSITAVKLNGKWILMDVWYDFIPTDKGGNPLSAEEIRKDWNRIKLTVPPHYIKALDYHHVMGTNWGKFGLLSRGLYAMLRAAGVPNLDQFSARSYVLNLYWAYFLIWLGIGAVIFPIWFYRLFRLKVRQ